MANEVTESHVFKFVSLRPPTPPARRATDLAFVRDARPAKETPVGRLLSTFNPDNAAQLPDALRRFIDEQHYTATYPQDLGDTRLDGVEAAVRALPRDQLSNQRLVDAVATTLDAKPAEFMTATGQAWLTGIWDRYQAFLVLGAFAPQNLESLTRNLRILHLVDLLARDAGVPDGAALDTVLAATPVIDPLFTNLPRAKSEPPAKAETLSEAQAQQYSQLWRDLVDTHLALDEVRGLRRVPNLQSNVDHIEQPNHETGVADRVKVTRMTASMQVESASLATMRPQTHQMLMALGMEPNKMQPAQAVGALTTKLQRLNDSLAAVNDTRFLSLMPPKAQEIRGLQLAVERQMSAVAVNAFPGWFFENVRASIKPLGIGDLKVVKQKLRAYVAGEVAHIENVLRGENKERRFRVLDRTEEIITAATETEEETTRDTQTTDRFELKKESEKTIQEQMSVQAGVTVSGSYGMVTFGAHGDFAYSTASQQSEKSASNFAHEVVDKAVSRVQKKTREERVTKQLHEVEELDTHGIDNRGQPDHVTGVYRWVDKHYEAQIYNYGRRLMFEFIVPEPAAYWAWAQVHKPKEQFTQPAALPAGLTHRDINEGNFQNYIRDYQVQGASPPPPEFKVMSITLSSDAKIENGTPLAKSSKDLVAPEGYVVQEFGAAVSFVYQNHPQFKLSVGTDDLWITYTNNTALNRWDGAIGTTPVAYDGIVPVSIVGYDLNAYYVNVTATCVRRPEKYEAWQISTFEKIVAAHTALQAAYDQKVAQQAAQAGVVIHGQNPAINREIERTELKKWCVKLLLDSWQFGSYNATKQTKDQAPDFDLKDAVAEGKSIQFFEQAFEWENLTYLFYPYFWGRENQWVDKLTTFDTDPLFTKFLQAGAARVVMPVRPGYNDAVMYYLEHNGTIWAGGDTPRLDDPLFVSLADELRNQTDDLQGATPEGDPWQVVLPTTLVWLQPDGTLPTFP